MLAEAVSTANRCLLFWIMFGKLDFRNGLKGIDTKPSLNFFVQSDISPIVITRMRLVFLT